MSKAPFIPLYSKLKGLLSAVDLFLFFSFDQSVRPMALRLFFSKRKNLLSEKLANQINWSGLFGLEVFNQFKWFEIDF